MITANDDETKACLLSALGSSVKMSSKIGVTLGFLHQLNEYLNFVKHR